jgi:hypothetical protein
MDFIRFKCVTQFWQQKAKGKMSVEESILPVQQKQISGTGSASIASSTAQASDPYVLRCRLERSTLLAHSLALRKMLQRQAELEDQLFACQAGEPMAAILSRPSPLMGEPSWANRFKAENLRNSREVIDAMMTSIAKALGVDD